MCIYVHEYILEGIYIPKGTADERMDLFIKLSPFLDKFKRMSSREVRGFAYMCKDKMILYLLISQNESFFPNQIPFSISL